MTATAQIPGGAMVQQTAGFVLSQLARHRSSWNKETMCPPLVVGVQGPQGAGKSHLTGLLPDYLEKHYGLRLATMSLDDFYLTHSDQVKLSQSEPDNPLLNGRGPAGTHDLPLLEQCLAKLKSINDRSAKFPTATKDQRAQLPIYDKSLFKGEGDRSKEVVEVQGPIDVVIFEGWMNGFGPLSNDKLEEKYAEAGRQWPSSSLVGAPGVMPTILLYSRSTLHSINQNLRQYEVLWDQIDCFVQIRPLDLSYVWTWRLQQEHNMKAKNGGNGMTDEQVRHFINRYMPSYELFQDGIDKETTSWRGKGLRFIVNIKREIVGTESF
ncbi:D-glycerate 3-kinase [Cryptococcus neoformans var. grubii Br795]|uniref:D-glycerate 3-kinase n=1 Tax=Cryptococcus neoformans Tu259-1 TaxID=1230072 RepID=A0A854QEJ7_CRYNE|nr:D-glycerate 3-kinase [Cryptococcus neoformans var. grubii AD1-83a]OWZ51883.1 D-glycerate 3-kinase [Cryptococcus neoformans var. grubii 125.91]OXG14904.1 D-glycerate 3-kinase [Cryptococcus neoformans var. grubii Tu259-1]OXG28622.1 D-glycerate 3-kinase [Cryptococcus neoformans var. grubii Bt15]OXG36490.1 D-glycerate 3-kinase [Cryptococcus neoformans var. grubii Bt120]OXG47129.1 D-glycerate 3-kinase [Cryptococcus neoformans var. grubii Th84]OXG52704.1 D-glycerate 3-kinase [Cryptococcus neofor